MRICATLAAAYLLAVLVIGVTTIVVIEACDGRVDIGFRWTPARPR
jgi:hypothetical protein